MTIDVLYSDSSIVVIDKPQGMPSVPGLGMNKHYNSVSIIKEMFPKCIDQPSVHRLDMDTSGLQIFAITKEAHRSMSILFQNQKVNKKYIAVLDGKLFPKLGKKGVISLRFRLDPQNRPIQVYDSINGKMGITEWKLLEQYKNTSRVLFLPKTGRTHQLRLHSAFPVNIFEGQNMGGLGCPILGDRLYGNSSDSKHKNGERMLLHASEIEFKHPLTGRIVNFFSKPDF